MLAFTFLAGMAAKAQGSKIFEKFENKDGITTMNISGSMFNSNMAGEIDFDGAEEILKKINSIQLIIAEDSANYKNVADNLRRDVRALMKSGFEPLIQVKSNGEKVDVRFHETGKEKGELLIFVDDGDSLVSVFIEGKFTSSDAKKLAKELRDNDDINLGF